MPPDALEELIAGMSFVGGAMPEPAAAEEDDDLADDCSFLAHDTRPIAFDRASVRSVTVDGRMQVELNPISKANVCPYYGKEIPDWDKLGLDPEKVYMLLRDPEELEKAASTFNEVPLLLIHKPSTANAHPREVTIGTTGSNAQWQDPYLMNTLSVWDGEGIEAIESDEQKELSSGYRYRADMTPGEFNGEHYDGVMRDIVGNHVALVEEGRAGPDVVVGDSAINHQRNQIMKIKTAVLPSRKALLAQAVCAAALAPRIAQDAKPVILGPVFEGVTRKNFKAMRPKIVSRLKLATDKKLAKDADLEDVIQFIDAIEGVNDGDADEDEVTIDADLVPGAEKDTDPEDTNKGVAKDEGGDREALMAELKAKLDGETYAKVATALSPPGSANDPTGKDGDPKAMLGGGAEDEGEGAEEDKKEADKKDFVSKGAMDKAIKAAVAAAILTTRDGSRAAREAENLCRPHVGELSLAMDSAEAIYRHTLETVYPDRSFKDLNVAALKAMVEMIPPPGKSQPAPRIALDAKKAKSFDERFPGASRIRTL
jgi:hypothetical protein